MADIVIFFSKTCTITSNWSIKVVIRFQCFRFCDFFLDSYVPKTLTHLSLASLLWDIGKQNSPRCDAAERGVPSGAILFAWRIFIEKLLLKPLKVKVDSPK